MWDARSVSLPILRPASTTLLLGPEAVPGCQEGANSVVSAGASPRERNQKRSWWSAGSPYIHPCWGDGDRGSSTESPEWPCVVEV